jgi:uncharacterized protein YbjT (DUF2867 family)
MEPEILVMGAMGNVGTEVVRSLAAKNIPVRAADLFPDKIRDRFGSDVQVVRFDFSEPATFADTFKGIRKVFVMRPPQISNIKRDMVPALEAAKTAGVEHMVFLSLIGIEQNKMVPHYQVEKWILASGLNYTFLRCSFFMQNLNTTHLAEIRDRDEIYIPVGNAKTSFLDVRDIGEVAALALTEKGHTKKAYDLTGSEALDYYKVAEMFTEVLGRKITYQNPSSMQFFRRQTQNNKLMFAVVTTWLYDNTRKGMAETVTSEVKRLLGRDPILMRKYIEDYRSDWKK